MKAIKIISALILMSIAVMGQEYPVKQITFCDSMHDGYPSWTRDGKSIIFDSGSRAGCHAMKVPAAGGTPVPMTTCFSQHSHISPDGTKLVFDGDFGKVIQIADLNGGTPEQLVPSNIPIRNGGFPRWSSDGKMMTFLSGADVWIMETEKKEFRMVYHADGKVSIPFCWVPGNREILIDSRDTVSRKSEIYKISLDGKPAVQLTSFGAYTAKADISPDGKMILFSSNKGGNFDVWVMKAEGGTPVQLTFYKGQGSNPGYDMEACWSPDGKKIAFSSTRSNYWAIWVMEPNLAEIRSKLGIKP